MARVTTFCAPAWLALGPLCAALVAFIQLAAPVQGQMVAPPMNPGAQPQWLSPAPMFQVGPNGAVNIDQPMMPPGAQYGAPMMMPGSVPMMPPAASPMYCDCPQPCGGQACPNPCATQPCPSPTMYMMPSQPCPPPPPPPPQLQWSVFAEAMWIHPTGADVAHAQQQNGIGGAGTVPFGEIGVADPSYDIGFRLGGEVRLAADAGVFASYTFFEGDAMSSVSAPNIPGGGGAVGSLVHHPGAAITGSVGPVDASYDIDFQLGDVAYRKLLYRNCNQYVSVFAGARFAQLEQDFVQNGIFGGGLGGAIQTATDVEFTGAGPMAGIDGAHQIGVTRFSVYGKALAASLTGQFDSNYRMFNDSTATLLAESMWQDDRIVPMLEYELGVAWTSPQGHLRLALGYMVSYWFNTVTTPVFIDAVQADNYVDVGDTLSFDGAVGRVEWVF
jgi:hypothetical protein